MQQKITWMHFLLIGISIISFFCIECKKTDYQVKAKWIYINETGHNITYNPNYWNSFNIKPYDTTIYYQDSDGSKEITENDYVSPFSGKVIIIYFDNIKCDTLKSGNKPNLGDGPLGMTNYKSKKLDERYYEFTYKFTEDNYIKAHNCK